MSDGLHYTRASKIRRFGPLAATSGNRSSWRDGTSEPSKDPVQSRSPLLSNEIQRSLLHVGMRVRKSVPGGYRTGPAEFERSLMAHVDGTKEAMVKPHAVTKKRTLEQDSAPRLQPDLTIQTVLSFDSAPQQIKPSKVRSFAIPKSRKPKPNYEPMDIDTQMFVDENGDFKDAGFLEF